MAWRSIRSTSDTDGGAAFNTPDPPFAGTDQLSVVWRGSWTTFDQNHRMLVWPYTTGWDGGVDGIFSVTSYFGEFRFRWAKSASDFDYVNTGVNADLTGKQRMYAITRNATTVKVFTDGVQTASVTGASGNFQTGDSHEMVVLGRSSYSVGESSQGYVSFVGVWARVLSNAEIGALYRDASQLVRP